LVLQITAGSLASVIAFCFFTWSFKLYTNNEKNKHILFATIGYAIIWEAFGLMGIYGTFDWKDIVAGFISGGITFILKEFMNKKILKEKE
jgi:hypothetical protein